MTAPSTRYAHAILDRDGTLNREADGGWVLDPSAWVWEDGVLGALHRLTRAGVRISIASNQSCVGRGMVGLDAVSAVNARAEAEARAAGASLAAFYVCPHVDADACACRKPAPGLIERAVADSDVAATSSIVVGDSLRDLQAARGAGVDAALVLTGHGRRAAREAELLGVAVFADLAEAADYVIGAGLRTARS